MTDRAADLKSSLLPTLDGVELSRDEGGVLRARNGEPIDAARERDVVWLNPDHDESGGWWSSLALTGLDGLLFDEPRHEIKLGDEVFTRNDVTDMLAGIGELQAPSATLDIDAGFFHRTLTRWADEGGHHDEGDDGVLWSYDFWRADIEEHEEDGSGAAPSPSPGEQSVHRYLARVYRGEEDAPDTYRYWIARDGAGGITRSGWLSDAPDMLEGGASFRARNLDDESLASLLFSDDGA